MNTIISYVLLIGTLGFFGYIGYNSVIEKKDIEKDEYLSARNSKDWVQIGLSLFASGMGVWLLFGPAENAYYGGFFDVLGYALSASTPFILLAYLGPYIRNSLPEGVTLADYVRSKIGREMQLYVGIISIIYMFTFLFAEFTAIGRAMEFMTGMNALIPIILVALVTAAYTAFGGLPASIRTDKWQAWFILWLFIVIILVFIGDTKQLISDAAAFTPEDLTGDEWHWEHGSISTFTMTGFLSGLALIIAITSAEMFSQGNWQRVYASEDDDALNKGALLAAGMVFPLMFIMGFLGSASAGKGALDDPSLAFFALIKEFSPFILSFFIVFGIALVCSSADTLQNAIVASISRDISDNKLTLEQSRYVALALVPLAIIMAWYMADKSASVFAIFLFADLLATATVIPIFLTLSSKINSGAALSGAVGGLVSVFLYGWLNPLEGAAGPLYNLFPDRIATGAHYIFKPINDSGTANFNVFLTALLSSLIITILASNMLTEDNSAEE